MGILYPINTYNMNTIGIMVRKINIDDNGKIQNPSTKNLHKQINTLHKKLKKKDKEVTTNYVIEKDTHKSKYHTHLLIDYTNKENLYNELSRFIGGNIWKERKEGFETIYGCNGKFGEVDTHYIYDEVGFLNYMNKKEISEILI